MFNIIAGLIAMVVFVFVSAMYFLQGYYYLGTIYAFISISQLCITNSWINEYTDRK